MCSKPVIDAVFHKLSAHGRRWKNACDADYTTLQCKRRWPSTLPYVYGSSDDRSTHIPRWRRNSRTSRCHSSRQQTPLRDAHQPHDNAFQMRWRYIVPLGQSGGSRLVDGVSKGPYLKLRRPTRFASGLAPFWWISDNISV